MPLAAVFGPQLKIVHGGLVGQNRHSRISGENSGGYSNIHEQIPFVCSRPGPANRSEGKSLVTTYGEGVTAMTLLSVRDALAQRLYPALHVGETRVVRRNPFEEFTGTSRLAGAVIEIGQRIGPSEMLIPWTLR
jgi:hypothetical protein